MNAPNWLDSLLWSISRAYRRRKIKRSHVYTELLAPARSDAEALDRALERPAILSRVGDYERRTNARVVKTEDGWALFSDGTWMLNDRPVYERGGPVTRDMEIPFGPDGRVKSWRAMGPSQTELLREKLTDEAMMHGSWPPSGQGMEFWCEHCPQYGFCSVCSQTHDRAGGSQ